jgi:hypothetical protein
MIRVAECRHETRTPGCLSCSVRFGGARLTVTRSHRIVQSTPPCRYRSSDPILRGKSASLGLSTERNWYECGHPNKPLPATRLGLYVCPCDGCGPNCSGYRVPQAAASRGYSASPDDPKVGIVVGCYGWPELAQLQIQLIRHTCGPVPILIAPDDPANDSTYESIIRNSDANVWHMPNPLRIGHTGGDVSALYKGLQWSHQLNLTVLVKLSQRFLIDRTRWAQDAARELIASGLPLATRRCRGKAVWPLRTEAMVLDVAAWNRPSVLARITPRRYWSDRPAGYAAEEIISDVLKDKLGGVYWPWSLFGDDRFRPEPGIIWHNSSQRWEYEAIAERHGMTLSSSFHTGGWEREREHGEYLYG